MQDKGTSRTFLPRWGRQLRIGTLTGGGDCPGLNAVIRAVVRTANGRYGDTVVGFRDGWRGLLEDRKIISQNDDRTA